MDAQPSSDAGPILRLKRFGIAWRYRIQAVCDALIVLVAVPTAVVVRLEFDVGAVQWPETLMAGAVAAVLQLAVGMLTGLYAGAARYASFDEVAGLTRAMVLSTTTLAIINRYVINRLVPVSASVMYGAVALLGCFGLRFAFRVWWERRRRPDPTRAARTVVFGAGEAGSQVITAMLRDPDSPYIPVGLIDDDPRKTHLRISGVPVMGRSADLASVAERQLATHVLVAIPSAGNVLIRDVVERSKAAGLQTMVLPPTGDLLGDRVDITDIRPVSEEDLLGRNRVDTDVAAIADYVAGKRVLVTGAGGSIGSELCRQLSTFGPAELIMLDRDESGLHATQLSIDGRGQLDTRALVVADIRDADRLDEVWNEWKPHVVFHAAALKHVPLLEMYPEEGRKTNVVGSGNVLAVSAKYGVERYVNISTDKAADPINVLGTTKREAELLTAKYAESEPGTYVSVRFGNVLGSRGSVLTAFRRQIAEGGPVTVTHPEVTRYFMTVEEAVQLVIQAGAIGGDGEVLILRMGDPVKIVDVAQQMVDSAGGDIEIVFTGLRDGEKMHEILVGADEEPVPGPHPSIMHVSAATIDRSKQRPRGAESERDTSTPGLRGSDEQLGPSGDSVLR